MRRYQRNILGSFFALGLIVLYFTGSAIVKANPEAKLQVIPENIIVSPALLKEPPKFKGGGFTPEELVLVDIMIPKGMEVIGLEKGEDKVGLAFTHASNQGDFEVAMDSMAIMQTLLQVPWVETETGTKPDFKQARGFPPGVYTILAIGMDSELRAMSTLTILPPPMKK
jgi:hypothetical protein